MNHQDVVLLAIQPLNESQNGIEQYPEFSNFFFHTGRDDLMIDVRAWKFGTAMSRVSR